MSKVTRRHFCLVTGAGLVAAACGDNGNGSDGGGGRLDMAVGDLSMPSFDLAMQQANCPVNGKLDVGPASSYAVGDEQFFSCEFPLFVLRDVIGIYAMSAICTHQGCTIAFTPANHDFECPCHLSSFDLNGNVTGGPAPSPLTHYPCTLDGNGHVIVDINNVADPSTRLVIQD